MEKRGAGREVGIYYIISGGVSIRNVPYVLCGVAARTWDGRAGQTDYAAEVMMEFCGG